MTLARRLPLFAWRPTVAVVVDAALLTTDVDPARLPPQRTVLPDARRAPDMEIRRPAAVHPMLVKLGIAAFGDNRHGDRCRLPLVHSGQTQRFGYGPPPAAATTVIVVGLDHAARHFADSPVAGWLDDRVGSRTRSKVGLSPSAAGHGAYGRDCGRAFTTMTDPPAL